MATTLSFVVGKGSLSHNNRKFIAENVDKDRIVLNRFYKQESIEDAYDKIFGTAIAEYNAKQTRADRKIDDYITKIKNSKNREKVFYENVVQIGKMTDFGILDSEGNITDEAKLAAEILDEYVRTFQERNPNLYLFNAVLHMDEATPHLHLDYIPVAHKYKTGMKTRNSLTKALQQMGFEKAKSRLDNETVHWQARERQYLTDLCKNHGIEIEVLGVDRDDYTIPEYKAAMKAKAEAEAEIEILNSEKAEIIHAMEEADDNLNKLDATLEDKEVSLKEIEERIATAESIRKCNEKKLEAFSEDSKNINTELAKIEEQAVDVPSLFGGEPMVKLPKKSFDRLIKVSKSAMLLKRVSDRYEAEISAAKAKISKLTKTIGSLKGKMRAYEKFIDFKGLGEAMEEFIHPKAKSTLAELEKVKTQIRNQPVEKCDINTTKKYEMEV